MPVTFEEVLKELDREEPDYKQAATLGAEALPHLRKLIEGSDLGLAVKAACLAGYVNTDESTAVLALAAQHTEPEVRVAAAASARNCTRISTALATTFLDDPDPGVRKWVLKTLEAHQPQGVKARVQKIMTDDPVIGLREQARKIVDRLK